MKKTLWVLPFVAILIGGCNGAYLFPSHTKYTFPGRWVPLAEMYPPSYQFKMQAAHHWDLLAQAEAKKIGQALKGDKTALYIEGTAKHSGDFHQAFRNLLSDHLVSDGRVVFVDERAAKLNDAYTLRYTVQVVKHSDRQTAGTAETYMRKNDLPFEIKLREDEATPTEALVTTQITHHGRLLMSDSVLYYLNTGDTENYTINLPPVPLSTTLVQVVSTN